MIAVLTHSFCLMMHSCSLWVGSPPPNIIYIMNTTNIYCFYWIIATCIDVSFLYCCHRNCFFLDTSPRQVLYEAKRYHWLDFLRCWALDFNKNCKPLLLWKGGGGSGGKQVTFICHLLKCIRHFNMKEINYAGWEKLDKLIASFSL